MNARQLIAIGVGCLLLGGICFLFFPIPRVSLDKVRAEILSEVPPGTKKEAVLAFLDGRHIEHSTISGGTMDAIIRDTCVAYILECSIQMKFSFDKDGVLLQTRVETIYSGL
jgi:hypothetical protein